MEKWKLFKTVGDTSYEVSNYGRIRSIKLFSPNLRGGYLSVTTKENVNRKLLVHRLVAESFVGNDDSELKNVVHHKNGNKLDNNADNLEWTTQSQNIFEYFKQKKSDE